MASLAHDAISIVLREHAGRLKSFEADRRKILNKTYEMLRECHRKAGELTNAGQMEAVERIREQTLKRIRTIAPTEEDYTAIWFKTVDNWKQQLADDKRKERRRVKRRTDRAD